MIMLTKIKIILIIKIIINKFFFKIINLKVKLFKMLLVQVIQAGYYHFNKKR